MNKKPVVSGIGAVFNIALTERIRQRAILDAAQRLAEARMQVPGQYHQPQTQSALPASGLRPLLPIQKHKGA